MGLRVCLIPGDGIGPEVTAAARRVLDATGVGIEWETHEVGEAAHRRVGEALPESVLASVRECGLALKGPVATRPGDPFRSVNVTLRERLDLFLGVRPCRAMPGAPTRFPGADVVVMRMHHGDLYAGIDFAPDDPTAAALRETLAATGAARLAADAGISVKPISRAAAERAARAAFAWARDNGRRRVTVIHKANVMRGSDGVFLAAARDAAAGFPELAVDDCLVDRACADLIRHPDRFDAIFAPMLYGDMVSDLTAAMCGGLGVAPGANLGDGCAVFEAVHGTSAHRAGKGTANPMAMILSGAMLLRQAGEEEAGLRVAAAVAAAVAAGEVTDDLAVGGSGAESTEAVAEAIAEGVR